MRGTAHIDPLTLLHFAEGSLDPDRQGEVELHLRSGCTRCRKRFVAVSRLVRDSSPAVARTVAPEGGPKEIARERELARQRLAAKPPQEEIGLPSLGLVHELVAAARRDPKRVEALLGRALAAGRTLDPAAYAAGAVDSALGDVYLLRHHLCEEDAERAELLERALRLYRLAGKESVDVERELQRILGQ